MIKTTTYSLLLLVLLNSCGNPQPESKVETPETPVNSTQKVLLSSEIVWEQLNPARGDQSPQAGTIWGDRKGTEATGFLAKFVDGFSSPPHIHNVTYRAVVIKGLIHNDDPNAENMWMPSGSFWTQPAGESHITSAKGEENIALVEIDHGPYLVKPISEAFDNGERPVNLDTSNIVWLDGQKSNWIDPNSNAEISFLMDTKTATELKSLFVKLPKNHAGTLKSNGDVFHAVVIKGELNYTMPASGETKTLDPGSSFTAMGDAVHSIASTSEETVILFVRTNGAIKVN